MRQKGRLCLVVGTRPEIIKMASIIHELHRLELDFILVHSGQHYDPTLSGIFFKELRLPTPDYNLVTGSGSQASQTARAMVRLESVFKRTGTKIALVQGDTNTTLAGALAGAKMGIEVGHVEAGLRSYDLQMPEEHNRRVTDHLSNYLFAPTKRARNTLRREDCWGAIYLTGNTVIDACLRYGPQAASRPILNSLPFDRFVLATVHRAENVDHQTVLRDLLEVLTKCPIPVVYPIHPRTRARLRAAGLMKKLKSSPNVVVLNATGYIDFLALLMKCEFVLTDSGGIQEEITAANIRKKAFILRLSTERPEAVQSGYAEVVGTNPRTVLKRIERFLDEHWRPRKATPFGDGKAGRKIVEVLDGLFQEAPQ